MPSEMLLICSKVNMERKYLLPYNKLGITLLYSYVYFPLITEL